MNAPLTIPQGLVYRLSRAVWDRMVESGVLEGAHVELIDGVMVEMCPENAAHATTVRKISRWLARVLPGGFIVSEQHPLRLADTTEPEPDIAVVPEGDYDDVHPTTAVLVIEVADSSLRHDRSLKRIIYARAQIPEYWIVNLQDRVIEVHTEPEGDSYRTLRVLKPGDRVAPGAFPELAQGVEAMLPRSRATT